MGATRLTRRAKVAGSLIGVGALGVGGFVAYTALSGSVPALFAGTGCTATVNGRTVGLDGEQAENAAIIVAISVGRGLPARAASIALATAYQESKIYNLDTGDRDSLGLFQQRPSQGWGTKAQVTDPVYATNAFYTALLNVSDYRTIPITEAAQEVQHSGYPEAYARHEADARVLASALTGNSPHAFTCTVADEPSPGSATVGANGLTPRAAAVRTELAALFGTMHWAPGDHGRTVDVGLGGTGSRAMARGWAMAQYAVARAARLHIDSVAYDGQVWTATRSGDGWRPSTARSHGLRIRAR